MAGASYKVKCVPRMTRASFSNSKYFLQWAHLTSGKPETRLLEKLHKAHFFFEEHTAHDSEMFNQNKTHLR
jgi:hypothetical protein